MDGCLEHTFLLSSILQHSRSHRKNITIIWLDLKDAFESVPHPVLFEMLGRAGLNGKTLQIIEDIYRSTSYHVRTNGGLTEPIPAARGVEQGCPLSPILFNLVIEGALRAVDTI